MGRDRARHQGMAESHLDKEAVMVQNLTASIMRRLGYQPYPMR